MSWWQLAGGALRIRAIALAGMMLVSVRWVEAAPGLRSTAVYDRVTLWSLQTTLPPDLWLSLSGCDPSPVEGACARKPSLQVEMDQADGPSTYALHARLGGANVQCPATSMCLVDLPETGSEGKEVEFWVETPEGKRGESFTARLRVFPAADPSADGDTPWFVQVLSSQWVGEPVDACAVAWDTFPPLVSPPAWLATPERPEGIASEVVYHYLAAELITAGAVDVRDCEDGGLAGSGAPSACGIEKAGPTVIDWQNQFDGGIFDAAARVPIPAALVKDVIAQESQFWPGSVAERGEYGLGHLTEVGADNTLLWNKEFYAEICPTVIGDDYCSSGYAHQSDYRRSLLRGSLIARVDADCAECEWGVDLKVAGDGVQILAESLLAYCSQTGRMVANVTGQAPGRSSSYEEMWKITLASYAAGPGCLADALQDASRRTDVLTWDLVSSEMPGECAGVSEYVGNITR